jgi:hypothetical protein
LKPDFIYSSDLNLRLVFSSSVVVQTRKLADGKIETENPSCTAIFWSPGFKSPALDGNPLSIDSDLSIDVSAFANAKTSFQTNGGFLSHFF